MAIDRFDTLDLNAGDADKFYRDDFGERIQKADEDWMPGDDAASEEDKPADSGEAAMDQEWAEGASDADKRNEDDFHETLDNTDQVGDESLMEEAEADYNESAGKTDDQDVDRV